MTVCVAAICQDSTIVGASDRMLTAGDIQFEPPQPKVRVITASIVVLTAGDSALQTEILQNVQSDVQRRVEAEPENWWNVRDVANLYGRYCNQSRMRRAENSILIPVGLDLDTFISRQGEMDPQFIRQLASELINFEAPFVEAIICGNDLSGPGSNPKPHIYTARNSDITCEDVTGFAAIGAGAWHADSQFMFAKHTAQLAFPESLLLVYSAKRRAEVAPGVGGATDMFSIGPRLGSYLRIDDQHVASLERMHKDIRKTEASAVEKANRKVTLYVTELNKSTQITQQQAAPAEDDGGATPLDQEKSRDSSTEDARQKE